MRVALLLLVWPAAVAVGTAALARRSADEKDWGNDQGSGGLGRRRRCPKQTSLNVTKDQAALPVQGQDPRAKKWSSTRTTRASWRLRLAHQDPAEPRRNCRSIPSPERRSRPRKSIIDQPCCAFEPHALAMRRGPEVGRGKNSSPIAHNVNWTGSRGRNPGGNGIVPPAASTRLPNLKADKKIRSSAKLQHPRLDEGLRPRLRPPVLRRDRQGRQFRDQERPDRQLALKIWHETGWRNGAASPRRKSHYQARHCYRPGQFVDEG